MANEHEAPERIWLQVNGDPYDAGGEWTWCQHQIEDDDVEYVRADLSAPVLPPPGSEAEAEMVERVATDMFRGCQPGLYLGHVRDAVTAIRSALTAMRATGSQGDEGKEPAP